MSEPVLQGDVFLSTASIGGKELKETQLINVSKCTSDLYGIALCTVHVYAYHCTEYSFTKYIRKMRKTHDELQESRSVAAFSSFSATLPHTYNLNRPICWCNYRSVVNPIICSQIHDFRYKNPSIRLRLQFAKPTCWRERTCGLWLLAEIIHVDLQGQGTFTLHEISE